MNLGRIISFAEKVCSERNHPQVMRKYAFDNLDWSIKMKKLESFFNEALEGKMKT